MQYLYLILALCVLVLPIYYKTKRFTGFWGIFLFIIGFGALIIRLIILKDYPFVAVYTQGKIFDSFFLLGIPSIIFTFFGIFSRNFNKRIKKLIKLLPAYIFFGALQQIFFLWVFTDTMYFLTRNINSTFIISSIFFFSFHLDWDSTLKKFWPLLILFLFINTWIYLYWRNILPQVLLHGALGSVLFVVFTDNDPIKYRLG